MGVRAAPAQVDEQDGVGMRVKEACERLIGQAAGQSGMLVLPIENNELAEYVLVRRGDLELLLATWQEKRAS